MSKFKIALLPFAMFSAITANAAPMYIEVQLGTNNADVDTKTYTDTTGTIVVTDLKASYDYDSATSVGFELGTSINENFRVGASYSTMDLDFNSARVRSSNLQANFIGS